MYIISLIRREGERGRGRDGERGRGREREREGEREREPSNSPKRQWLGGFNSSGSGVGHGHETTAAAPASLPDTTGAALFTYMVRMVYPSTYIVPGLSCVM